MRIGILCHASFGGSARVATELGKELARRGRQVHLFSHTPPFGRWDAVSRLALHTLRPEPIASRHPADLYTNWQPEEEQALVNRIVEVACQEGLDLLHFHYAVPFAWIAQAVRQRLGRAAPRIVGTLHGTDVITHGRVPDTALRLRRALNGADTLTAVSDSFARLSQEVLHLARLPQVIPNFINLARFRPSQRLGGRPVILHVSNFRSIKNPQRIVQIFQKIRQQMEAELWLVGDGPEMALVKALLRQAGLELDVRYWGLQRDVAPIVAQADLLLVTSEYESFSLVALEAMACGVPVLATKVGGLPEVVRHGESGFLLPPDELDGFSTHAVAILSDKARHQAMARAATEQAQHFATSRIIPLYEACYHTLLRERLAKPGVGATARYIAGSGLAGAGVD
jgi:N-acetyl-alpha-D-glucosaminyl L-malate synthase BshA